MPSPKLTSSWTKIASAGQSARVINSGAVPVDLSTFAGGFGRPMPPGASQLHAELRTDLYARAADPKAELTVEARDLPPRDLF